MAGRMGGERIVCWRESPVKSLKAKLIVVHMRNSQWPGNVESAKVGALFGGCILAGDLQNPRQAGAEER